jgi:YD repeat-containing protein
MSHNPKLINYQTNINTSRVTAITRPSGATITNSYDKGRLVSTSTPEGTTSYSYLFGSQRIGDNDNSLPHSS